jgi:hypothetical protein
MKGSKSGGSVNLGDVWSGLRKPLLARPDPAEDERLLKLFWNRAELKKELQGLDDELHLLKDRLKQQEGATARLQEQLDQLESLLGHPERGYEALVHFAFRALWRTCRAQLEQFSSELRRQQQDRERKRQLAEFQHDREERLRLADERLREADDVAAAERRRLEEARSTLARLTGFWNYFRRRELGYEIEAQLMRCSAADRHLDDMREAHRTIEKEPWPEFPGLSVESRRAINVATIAYAQLLYARLSELGLARPARLAMNRSVHDARYGLRDQCMAKASEIQAAVALVRSQEGVAGEIRTRSDLIRAAASWHSTTDVIPLPESLPAAAAHGAADANVLIDDYWDLHHALAR